LPGRRFKRADREEELLVKYLIVLLIAASAAFVATSANAQLLSEQPAAASIVVNSAHSGTVQALAFSPDDKWLASAAQDATIKLWDLASGRLLRTLTGHSTTVLSVDVSSDGRLVASAADDGTIRIWEAATGKMLRSISVVSTTFDKVLGKVVFTKDAKSIFAATYNAIVRYDVASGTLQQKIPHAGVVSLWQMFA
jgi:WD40 repeat protein